MKKTGEKGTILLAGVLCTLCACGQTQPSAPVGETEPAENMKETAAETVTETAAPVYECEIPENADYDGYVFRILTRELSNSSYVNDMTAENTNGEVINDAVFQRNSLVFERLNISFKTVQTWEAADYLKKTVTADDDSYDAVYESPFRLTNSVTAGYLMDLCDLPVLDPDKPWWNKKGMDQMSVGGKAFFIDGDLDVNDNGAIWALSFNKGLYSENYDESLYDIVFNGKWTLDRLNQMCENIASDINGDGKMNEADRWGFINSKNFSMAMTEGAGETIISKDGNGVPVSSVGNARLVSVFSKIAECYSDKSKQYVCDLQQDGFTHAPVIFSEGRSLFRTICIVDINAMRQMVQDFGLVPVPKYEESQKEYHSLYHHSHIMSYAVPVTASDTERTGTILEYTSYCSKDTLTPAYYEKTLTGKYARDAESVQMLDIIFGSATYDIGLNYDFGFFDSMKGVATGNWNEVASGLEKMNGSIEAKLEEFYNEIMALEE